MDIIHYVNDNDKDKDVSIQGRIVITEDAAKHIGQGLNTIGSSLGLGGTIGTVAMAVSKGIAKSSMPPLQKAGVIVSAGVLGGMTHLNISSRNRNRIIQESNNKTIGNNISSDNNINKFLDDQNTSPLQDILLNIEVTFYTCLSLIVILSIQIIYKYYFKDSIKLNLSNLLGVKWNKSLEYYFNKIIILNKKMSIT
jgi:hypothetical protein